MVLVTCLSALVSEVPFLKCKCLKIGLPCKKISVSLCMKEVQKEEEEEEDVEDTAVIA